MSGYNQYDQPWDEYPAQDHRGDIARRSQPRFSASSAAASARHEGPPHTGSAYPPVDSGGNSYSSQTYASRPTHGYRQNPFEYGDVTPTSPHLSHHSGFYYHSGTYQLGPNQLHSSFTPMSSSNTIPPGIQYRTRSQPTKVSPRPGGSSSYHQRTAGPHQWDLRHHHAPRNNVTGCSQAPTQAPYQYPGQVGQGAETIDSYGHSDQTSRPERPQYLPGWENYTQAKPSANREPSDHLSEVGPPADGPKSGRRRFTTRGNSAEEPDTTPNYWQGDERYRDAGNEEHGSYEDCTPTFSAKLTKFDLNATRIEIRKMTAEIERLRRERQSASGRAKDQISTDLCSLQECIELAGRKKRSLQAELGHPSTSQTHFRAFDEHYDKIETGDGESDDGESNDYYLSGDETGIGLGPGGESRHRRPC